MASTFARASSRETLYGIYTYSQICAASQRYNDEANRVALAETLALATAPIPILANVPYSGANFMSQTNSAAASTRALLKP